MPRTRDPEQTRTRLLRAAYDDIHQRGFQAASLSDIAAKAGVTKGALHHHFPNKLALGYAVVEEVIHPYISARYLQPLRECRDPIATVKSILEEELAILDPEAMARGCPINNLSQEMSSVDEGFRLRIDAVLDAILVAIADALRRGQDDGHVRQAPGVDAGDIASIVLATRQGAIGLCKSFRDKELAQRLLRGMGPLLDGLRPGPPQS